MRADVARYGNYNDYIMGAINLAMLEGGDHWSGYCPPFNNINKKKVIL